MKRNIIATLFNNQPQAFQAFSELKAYKQTSDTVIVQALLLKKENGVITQIDNHDFDAEISNKALAGGLIGSAVGVLGGPFGMLLGGSLGALFGTQIGATETLGEVGLLYSTVEKMQDGDTVILVLALEKDESTLDAFFGQYDTVTARWDLQAVQDTVADKLKAEIDAQNIEQSAEKAKKAQERADKFNEFKADVQSKLDAFAKKFKS
ncbi:hypothetical protein BG910_01785 [Neisseria chenwenguii]|uniref:DUF1269 domain-containing protein n=1 Tax=Neisseria chenwenguii TaxID=1853278 RepID=A0A220RZI0_9NEIS|nr:DUF456 domain-containing protein [Neisseria chenwenguii]ASK26640.1 hypothetical protein BG910_01785 [Neisseria chenwenguii]